MVTGKDFMTRVKEGELRKSNTTPLKGNGSGHKITNSIAPNPSPLPKKPERQIYSAMNQHKMKFKKQIKNKISKDFE